MNTVFSRKVFLSILFSLLFLSAWGQRKVIDTLFVDGVPVAYTETNWFVDEGDKVPDFTVYGQDGSRIRMKDLRGKVVAISFWITTCGPCKKELGRVGPEMVDVFPKDSFAFLAIGSGQEKEDAEWFASQSGATFPLCYDPSGKVFGKFADNGFPKVFVIDRKGIVRYMDAGYSEEKFSRLKGKIAGLISE